MNLAVRLSEEVKSALAQDEAVVALESTIISHGMPWPENVDTALRVEACVREQGATPATIAILDGALCVGLEQQHIERVGKAGEQALKVSRRDIPFALIDNRVIGSTTVAATMIIAELAGIRIFATGGIGGVHRGAETSFDISADLEELARTSVAVVCAGAKSILDIGLTREYLETRGVPVIGWQTDFWPAFYSRSSQHRLDYNLDDETQIATALRTKWELPLAGGALICAPIPAEHAIEDSVIDTAIGLALKEMQENGISGKDSTPFLLKKIVEITDGASLEANLHLIQNNARVAGRIAVAYALAGQQA